MLEVRERVLGAEHPQTLTSLNNLAVLFKSQGRYGEAEPLIQRAVEGRTRALGIDHPQTLSSLNTLAEVYQAQGRYEEAEQQFQFALEASVRTLGKEHPQSLTIVNHLAWLYRKQGRYPEAEPLFQDALAASKRTLGDTHPQTLRTRRRPASLYTSEQRLEKSEQILTTALAASQQVLGASHPETLAIVSELADVYRHLGRFEDAEPLYRRAVDDRVRTLGPEHVETLGSLAGLASLYAGRSETDQFEDALRRWDRAARSALTDHLATTRSARVKRAQLSGFDDPLDVACTAALDAGTSALPGLCADMLLRWKRVESAESEFVAEVARRSEDPEIRLVASEIATARAALSRLTRLRAAEPVALARERERLEGLENQLATMSRPYRDQFARSDTDWRQISAALPLDAVLVDFRRIDPIDFLTDERGTPRWLAVLIHPEVNDQMAPEVIDLGEATDIDALTAGFAGKLGPAKVEDWMRELYRALVEPLAGSLEEYGRIYLSPDSLLDQIPFAALTDGSGRYWIERLDLHLLRSGRELMASVSGPGSQHQGVTTIGGVDYDRYRASDPVPAVLQMLPADTRGAVPVAEPHSQDVELFRPLPGAGSEAKQLASIFGVAGSGQVELLTGTEAGEARLKGLVEPPRILHLATDHVLRDRDITGLERPLAWSGVALAGANRGLRGEVDASGEDGILYGLEALSLDLDGTELVTLSACDTGRGVMTSVDGTYGLVRAFQIAGARNVLVSLWQVDDRLTAEFMVDFYRNWLADNAHDEPAAALRATQREWLRSDDERKRDPYYWAPFVLWERH